MDAPTGCVKYTEFMGFLGSKRRAVEMFMMGQEV